MNKITVVTCTVYADGSTASWSNVLEEGESLEELIKTARQEAIGAYENEVGTLPAAYRVIDQVVEFDDPEVVGTTVRAQFQAQPAGEPVTARFS